MQTDNQRAALGRTAYAAAARTTECPQAWELANQQKWIAAADAVWQATIKCITELEQDAKRLDFMLENDAFLSRTKTDVGAAAYQIYIQDEDEVFHIISGDRFFKAPREAIDAAIDKAMEKT